MSKKVIESILTLCLSLILLIVGSSPTSMPKLEPKVQRVNESVISAYHVDPNKRLETNLIVDPIGQSNPNFQRIEAKLAHVSGSLYRGRLNAADVTSLMNAEGIQFERNLPAGTLPIPNTKNTKTQEQLYWDTEVLVNDADENLRATRYSTSIDGTGVLIAIIDTGVDSNAVGLVGSKVVHREDFSSPPQDGSCSDDGYLDPHGHGTHVASIAAGSDTLLEGVAPGAQIVDLRVLNCAGSGWMSDVDEALQWLIDNRQSYPVKVVNLSLGSSSGQQDGLDSTSILINRLVALGTFVAVAAGNGGTKTTNLYSPATSEFATTVAAATVTRFGSYLAPYSSHGPTTDGRAGIDITAPGSGIRAAQSTKFSGFWQSDPETTKAGTSMASPYVAGTAALLLQQHPEYLPSGQLCEVSDSCPSGVIKETMTNPVLEHFKATDWFDAGIDPHSGAGLVSASASLLGTNPSPAKTITASTDGQSDTVIRFDPSPEPKVVTFLLDSSWQTNIFDWSQRFNITLINRDVERIYLGRPCSILSWGSCMFGDQYRLMYSYVLPASETPLYFDVNTTSKTQMTITVDSYDGDISTISGIKVSSVDLTSTGSGIMTITRTTASSLPTSLSLSASGGVGIQSTVNLPAGPAGTEVTLQLEPPSNNLHTLEKVILRTTDDLLLYSEVQLSELPEGRIRLPDSFDTGLYDEPFMADDGTILGGSGGAGMRNGSGYPNPFIVQPGSLTPTTLQFNQTSPSMVETFGLSQDASTGLFGEFPAGSGIVSGDEDMFYTYFVTKLSTMQSFKVGPSSNNFASWIEQMQSYPEFKIDSDGSKVAWTARAGGNDLPWVLAVNSGSDYSQETIIDRFADRFAVSLQGISNGKILAKVISGSAVQLRLYDLTGNYAVLNSAQQNPAQAGFSKNGLAVGFTDANSGLYCWVNGLTRKITPSQSIGNYWYSEVKVADDCSWINTTRIFQYRDINGIWRGEDNSLIRVNADGTVETLASSNEATWFWDRWRSNSDATEFLTFTPQGLEPGDLNSQLDFYRGLFSDSTLSIPIKRIPMLYWHQFNNTFLNGSLALVNTESDSDNPIQFEVLSGPCHLGINNVLIADSTTGVCTVKEFVEPSSRYLAASRVKTFYISLPSATKKRSPIVNFNGLESLVFKQWTRAIDFPYGGGSAELISGPCQVDPTTSFILSNSGVGSCQVKFSLAETSLNYSGEWIKTFNLSRAKLQPGHQTIYIPDHMDVHQSMHVELRGYGVFGGEPPALSVTGPCRIDGFTLTPLAAGACYLTVEIAQNDFIEAFKDTVLITITGKLNPTVNFAGGTNLKLKSGVPLKLYSSSQSNGTVTYSVVGGPCRITGDSLYLTSRGGICLVMASFAETEIYFSNSGQAFFEITALLPKLTHSKTSAVAKGMSFMSGLAEAK